MGVTSLSLASLAVVICGVSGEIAQTVAENAYRSYAPAVGVLFYSLEVTNPNTGEVTKRENTAIALVVRRDGLLMAPGHIQLDNAQPFNLRVALRNSASGDSSQFTESKYEAILLKKPDDVNVCFLRLKSDKPLDLPFLDFKDDVALRLGEPILITGAMAESLDYIRCVMTARIGAILEKPRTTYCLDNGVRFGFVGGPVFNPDGLPVGVIGYDLSQNEGGDLYTRSGHPLVYQAALFRKYISNPPSENEVRSGNGEGWLGVFAQALTDDLAEYWKLPKEGGIVVSTVMPGAPAATAGLQMGDVILSLDGVPLRARTDREVMAFTKLLRDTPVGKDVVIKLLRDGKLMELTAKLTARPKSSRDAEEYTDKTFGLTVREITTDVRILLNLSEDVRGVIVRRVESGSVAASARMKPGLIILGIGDHPVSNLDDFTRALEQIERDKPAEVAVFCRFGTATGFFRMEPRWKDQ